MKIEKIFLEVMELDALPENFEDLQIGDLKQWDSLANMNFLMSLEKNFNIRFSFDEMSEMTSINIIKLRIAELQQ
jgi:acyl carrier protein|tara:strand:+ start:693 stop:917 length:225 start_codon:yes stop_codon:yes gene_type:complete